MARFFDVYHAAAYLEPTKNTNGPSKKNEEDRRRQSQDGRGTATVTSPAAPEIATTNGSGCGAETTPARSAVAVAATNKTKGNSGGPAAQIQLKTVLAVAALAAAVQ